MKESHEIFVCVYEKSRCRLGKVGGSLFLFGKILSQ